MAYRLRLRVKDQPEEYKVLISFGPRIKVTFEDQDHERDFPNAVSMIEFLAQFCFSGGV